MPARLDVPGVVFSYLLDLASVMLPSLTPSVGPTNYHVGPSSPFRIYVVGLDKEASGPRRKSRIDYRIADTSPGIASRSRKRGIAWQKVVLLGGLTVILNNKLGFYLSYDERPPLTNIAAKRLSIWPTGSP
jgi:hypothetical protein